MSHVSIFAVAVIGTYTTHSFRRLSTARNGWKFRNEPKQNHRAASVVCQRGKIAQMAMISTDLHYLAAMLRGRAIVADRLAPAELLAVALHLEVLSVSAEEQERRLAYMEVQPISPDKREPVTLRVVHGGAA